MATRTRLIRVHAVRACRARPKGRGELSSGRGRRLGEKRVEEFREVGGYFTVAGHKIAPGLSGRGLPRPIRVPAESEQGDRPGRGVCLGLSNGRHRIQPERREVEDRRARLVPERVLEGGLSADDEGLVAEAGEGRRDSGREEEIVVRHDDRASGHVRPDTPSPEATAGRRR